MLLPNRIANIHKKKSIKLHQNLKIKPKTIEILNNAIAVIIIS